jgi:putative DNA primase/helicase
MENEINPTKEMEELLARVELLKAKVLIFPDIGGKGTPKSTVNNLKALCAHYKITIRYNEMLREEEIVIPGKTFHSHTAANAAFAALSDLLRQHEMPIGELQMYVSLVANENAYHPVRDWIDSITWDGTSRLEEFYDTIESTQPMKEVFMRKWALSAVAALYHPNFSCEGVLVMTGRQGKGKSTYPYRILPKEIATTCVKDAVTLDVNNKDSVLKAVSTWITELGELTSTFRKSDLEHLKGFITERVDKLRPAYARKIDTYGRQTVFYATVNDEEFLQDGENRRFWVIDVSNFNSADYDRAQFWAEMKQVYMNVQDKISTPESREKNNEWGWFLSPQERSSLENNVEKFKSMDPIEQLVSNNIELNDKTSTEFFNCTAILARCGKDNPNRSELNRVAVFLRKQGFETNWDKKFPVIFKSKEGDMPTRVDFKMKKLAVLSPERD